MDLRSIRYFVHVAEVGNITLAASELGIVQPALSRQIRRLEQDLGAPLLERFPRGVQLTPAGRQFLDHCRRVLREIAAARESIALTRDRPGGKITFGLPGTLTVLLAPRLISNIRKAYPEVSLKIVEGPSALLHDALLSGQIQGAVLNNPPAAGPVRIRPLLSEALVFFTPPQSSVRRYYTVNEISKMPLVMTSGIHVMVDDQLASRGRRLSVEFEIDSVSAIRSILRSGTGSTILPISALREDVESGAVSAYPIKDISLHRLLAIGYTANSMSGALQAVMDAMETEIVTLAAEGMFNTMPEAMLNGGGRRKSRKGSTAAADNGTSRRKQRASL